jgi:HEPN domain-containing protein
MTWERGRKDIERLIVDGELERVAPSDEVASRLLADAGAHIVLASKGIEDDPAGALQLSYDAARKASAALLAAQGLRATTRGGHIAVIDAVKAQFNDRGGMEIFGRLHPLRRRRNRTEYPDLDSPGVNEDDASQALETAEAVVDAAKRLIDSGRLDPFE